MYVPTLKVLRLLYFWKLYLFYRIFYSFILQNQVTLSYTWALGNFAGVTYCMVCVCKVYTCLCIKVNVQNINVKDILMTRELAGLVFD